MPPCDTSQQIETAVAGAVEAVRSLNAVSFIELAGIVADHGLPTCGELAAEFPSRPNMILWAGMSPEFVEVTARLYDDARIDARVVQPWVYLADGGIPTVPATTTVPKRGYRSLRWLPIVFVWAADDPT